MAYDTFSGPFSLEIDYIGFFKDEQWNDRIEYEGYFHEESQLKDVAAIWICSKVSEC